eukprot:7619933-Pyramimonas_sp.AAC.1
MIGNKPGSSTKSVVFSTLGGLGVGRPNRAPNPDHLLHVGRVEQRDGPSSARELAHRMPKAGTIHKNLPSEVLLENQMLAPLTNLRDDPLLERRLG